MGENAQAQRKCSTRGSSQPNEKGIGPSIAIDAKSQGTSNDTNPSSLYPRMRQSTTHTTRVITHHASSKVDPDRKKKTIMLIYSIKNMDENMFH